MATASPDINRTFVAPTPSSRSALIVVDLQGAFCESTGSLSRLGMDTSPLREAIGGCQSLVGAAREVGALVVFTILGYRDDYADAGRSFWEMQQPVVAAGGLVRGTADTQLVAGIETAPDDVLIDKQHSDAFRGTNLDAVLRARRVDDVVVCGVTTSVCVAATARSASELGYRTWIAADASAETSTNLHLAALETFGRAYGYVSDTDSICVAWRGEEAEP